MEIFITDVPKQTGEHELRRFLKPKIEVLGIRAFHCHTANGKDFAKLTFRTHTDGQKFLQCYGERRPNPRRIPLQTYVPKLKFHGRPIYCAKSRWDANKFLLRCLERDEEEQNKRFTQAPPGANALFDSTSLMCGTLGYINQDLVFLPERIWPRKGTVLFKEKSMIFILDGGLRMVIRYDTIVLLTIDDGQCAGITVSLYQAPHFFKDPPKINLLSDITNMFGNINLNNSGPNSSPKRCRVPGFDEKHEQVSGICLVYRFTFAGGFSAEVDKKLQWLGHARGVPPMIPHSIPIVKARESYVHGLEKLHEALGSFNNDMPFPINFQIQRLAQNGFLSPRQVLDLFPTFKIMSERSTLPVCVAAIRRFANKVQFPGPNVEAKDLGKEALSEILQESEQVSNQEALYAEGFKGDASRNTALIHRLTITPAGIYLEGPENESNNRILRKYAGSHDHFIRVAFSDEDGGRVQYASNVSNDAVFDEVFKNILRIGFTIANHNYEYLGSSHSSLRSQSCWFVAPFHNGNVHHNAQNIVHDLGKFGHIRSPAKCAARIGQAFSDTPNAITLDDSVSVKRIPDVERNGRTFSDGVGTMSKSLMHLIWEKLPNRNLIKPTCFQIRYRGAKGMISLDSRLEGKTLGLRDSMVKFEGSSSNDLEICGGAYKPLPMYLNRQFIKILEDLGVEPDYFLKLQQKEVNRLRAITGNPFNASTFLYRKKVGDTALLSYLTEHCSSLDLDFRNDVFLRDVLEMAVLMELRTLKHKARIPYEDGYHLHGILDETGILEEGEIYCCWMKDGKRVTLVGKDVVISRAPALHPGDVQLVDAVNVPIDSPLKDLYNCVCFSQKGARDLPSMLSGGDLDGDLYYVMFDAEMKLKKTETPADYSRLPPLDIGRPVTQLDMSDNFLNFMKTDQLGIIANRHQIYADQSDQGTRSLECLKLAELHSTAVDFSKTGIPANVNSPDVPRSSLWRPDFMAPGPHIKVFNRPNNSIEFAEEHAPIEVMDEDDEFSNIKYYESHKACGRLYRAIDERQFFFDVKRANSQVIDDIDIMQHVWEFVVHQCQNILWEHWLNDAMEIREIYENSIQNIMHEYSEHPSRPISEREVFVGDVLGKVGSVSKKQRDLCTSMKEKYDDDVNFIINCIIKDGDGYANEALERSIACFSASLKEGRSKMTRDEPLKSFKYLAAGVCLREMERVPGLLPNNYLGQV